MGKQSDDIMDSMKYLMAALEADMYVGKKHQRKPYAGLLTLLAKLGIKSAMLDNRPLHIESLQDILGQVEFNNRYLQQAKKPCKSCPTKKCKNCPRKVPTQV